MQSNAGSWLVARSQLIYRDDLDNIILENLLSDNSIPNDASLVLISNNASMSLLKLHLLASLAFQYRIVASVDLLTLIVFSEFVLF